MKEHLDGILAVGPVGNPGAPGFQGIAGAKGAKGDRGEFYLLTKSHVDNSFFFKFQVLMVFVVLVMV